MANEEHLAILRKGVDVWNAWRIAKPGYRPDLANADLREADLRKVDLHEANLSWVNFYRANLSEADLSETNLHNAFLGGANFNKADFCAADLREADLIDADMSEANLGEANLSGADLRETNFNKANLRKADLSGANLREADLSEADLGGADLRMADINAADLSEVNLRGANLSKANLRGACLSKAKLGSVNCSEADLSEADLSETELQTDLVQASPIDARLDHADLTGAWLWETQRGGWSIKGVICQHVFWDRAGRELTAYGKGEFERIFAEKPRIILHYAGGISPIDLLALPFVVERLQVEYPGSVLQIQTMQNDAGGASVTITVEDRQHRRLRHSPPRLRRCARISLQSKAVCEARKVYGLHIEAQVSGPS